MQQHFIFNWILRAQQSLRLGRRLAFSEACRKKDWAARASLILLAFSGIQRESFAEIKAAVPVSPLSEARQLSFAGTKAGEGYFSFDGNWMVFQSERDPNNPFYQIYLADFKSGEVSRVSPGVGRATCAWIHPSKKKILFSSTHEDPLLSQKVKEELEFRKNPKGHRYSWDFDSAYKIYEQNLVTGKLRPLTAWQGYTAEASYSPDGKWIAFASNFHAYSKNPQEPLQSPEAEMEIYIMKSDGSSVRRLTWAQGYDGGPFFSPDGTHITWRRFNSTGDKAEIFTMKVDGSEQKAITTMGAMAWAPFYHPSGDYIIFTSNVLGNNNFELFVVDVEGKKNPQRVTDRPGFDGLPVFHPSGRFLSWTVKNAQGESQIYWGRWSDNLARSLLGISEKPSLKPKMLHAFKSGIAEEDLRAWVEHLANPYFEGRKTGDENLWMPDLQQYFDRLGLVTWRESFPFVQGLKLGQKTELRVRGQVLKLEQDFRPSVFSSTGALEEGEFVYSGSGLVASGFNAYASLDVKGKWVGFDESPVDLNEEQRAKWATDLQLFFRIMEAKRRGAKGVLIFSKSTDFTFSTTSKGESVGIGVFLVSQSIKARLVGGSTPETSSAESSTGPEPETSAVSGFVEMERIMGTGQVLMAELRRHRDAKTIAIGAHGDHLGHGHSGSSLAIESDKGLIHTGADDNASGVSVVMELAANLVKGRLKLESNYLFAVWSGEELGLLGSAHVLKNWKGPKISVGLNFDMVGRLTDKLQIQGTGSSPVFRSLIESTALQWRNDLSIASIDSPFAPTDSKSFQDYKIPALQFFTGSHPEYHTPKDRAETINYEGLYLIAKLARDVVLKLDSLPDVAYQDAPSSALGGDGGGRKFRVYVGTIPSYQGDSEQKGVLLSGVSPGSPAQKAGIQAGDILVRIADIEILSMREFGYAIKIMEAGKPIEFELLRAGKKVLVTVVPEAREV